jgi:hypothetical protein
VKHRNQKAKRSESQQASKVPPPEEWDFRGIPPKLLSSAIRYEYARESEVAKAYFKKWHNEMLPFFDDSECRAWNGLSVGEALKRSLIDGVEPPEEVRRALFQNAPGEVNEELQEIQDIWPLFPQLF